MTAGARDLNLPRVIRFIVNLFLIVVIGVGGGYFLWGSRLGNLTQALNTMILEQETLRAQLAGASGGGRVAVAAGGSGDAGLSITQSSDLSTAIEALKKEVQYQAKLIDQQTLVLNRISEDSGSQQVQVANCRENLQQLNARLQSCVLENGQLQQRLGSPPQAPSPGAFGQPVPQPVPQPRY